jgi:hypothetical protein
LIRIACARLPCCRSKIETTTARRSKPLARAPITPELVEAHLKLDRQVMDALRKTKAPVVPA